MDFNCQALDCVFCSREKNQSFVFLLLVVFTEADVSGHNGSEVNSNNITRAREYTKAQRSTINLLCDYLSLIFSNSPLPSPVSRRCDCVSVTEMVKASFDLFSVFRFCSTFVRSAKPKLRKRVLNAFKKSFVFACDAKSIWWIFFFFTNAVFKCSKNRVAFHFSLDAPFLLFGGCNRLFVYFCLNQRHNWQTHIHITRPDSFRLHNL